MTIMGSASASGPGLDAHSLERLATVLIRKIG